MSRKGFRCFECDGKAHHAHHVVPLSMGGHRTVPLCHDCHSRAHSLNFKEHSKKTREGIRRNIEAGGSHGRPTLEFDEAEALRLREAEGWYYSQIAKKFGVGTETMRKRIRKLQSEDS